MRAITYSSAVRYSTALGRRRHPVPIVPAAARQPLRTSDIRDPFESKHQCLRTLSAVPLSLKRHVELVHEREPRHGQMHPLGLAERNPHVLDEVRDDETGFEIALEH